MLQPNRHGGEEHSYGFQGQLVDNEIKGKGNSVNYKYRMADVRLGRFFAVDPLTPKYPHYTPYQFSGNKVIQYVELEGLEEGLPQLFSQEHLEAGSGTGIASENESHNKVGKPNGAVKQAVNAGGDFVADIISEIFSTLGEIPNYAGEKTGEFMVEAFTNSVNNNSPPSFSNAMSFGSESDVYNSMIPEYKALLYQTGYTYASTVTSEIQGIGIGHGIKGLKSAFSRQNLFSKAANMGLKFESTTAVVDYWPSNGGALGEWKPEYLMPGTIIDRFGSNFGKYLSPKGTPMTMRALPASNTAAYNSFKVIKPFQVQSSTIAPAFGEAGFGTQYLSPVNVNTLIKRGIIIPIH